MWIPPNDTSILPAPSGENGSRRRTREEEVSPLLLDTGIATEYGILLGRGTDVGWSWPSVGVALASDSMILTGKEVGEGSTHVPYI